ncbi:Trypsin [Gracilaria domingensis]|nr:Trypsin [Gracilaria domingensis]
MLHSNALVFLLLLWLGVTTAREKGNKILGGNRARAKVRKHLAKIKTIFKDGEGDATCSGSILGDKWLLSAAHCFTEPDDIYASVKRSYAYIAPKVARPEDDKKYYFKKVYLPKEWVKTRHGRYDIAVIELQDKIKKKKRNPVTIGVEPPAGKRVIIAGFGVIREGDDDEEWPDYPMQAKMLSKDIQDCKDLQDEQANQVIDAEFHVCTVSINFPKSKTDMCSKPFLSVEMLTFSLLVIVAADKAGDSGGPIFRKRNGKLEQYAVHTFAFDKCGTAGEQTYSTRLTAYQDAIENITGNARAPGWETI